MADTRLTAAPLTDAVIAALSRLVDDAQSPSGFRQPSHSEIKEQFRRAGLLDVDPNKGGKPIGKAKRVRAVLQWAIENNIEAGEKLVFHLLGVVRGVGGFRDGSPNFVGLDPIQIFGMRSSPRDSTSSSPANCSR